MKRAFICLDNQSYKLIRELHRKKLIPDREYNLIEDCQNYNSLAKIISQIISIDKEKERDIWEYVINHVWKVKKRGNFYDSTVYNKVQSWFFKQLLMAGGVCTREKLQKEDFTEQQLTNKVCELEEMELICSIKTTRLYGNRTIYFINPELLREI